MADHVSSSTNQARSVTPTNSPPPSPRRDDETVMEVGKPAENWKLEDTITLNVRQGAALTGAAVAIVSAGLGTAAWAINAALNCRRTVDEIIGTQEVQKASHTSIDVNVPDSLGKALFLAQHEPNVYQYNATSHILTFLQNVTEEIHNSYTVTDSDCVGTPLSVTGIAMGALVAGTIAGAIYYSRKN